MTDNHENTDLNGLTAVPSALYDKGKHNTRVDVGRDDILSRRKKEGAYPSEDGGGQPAESRRTCVTPIYRARKKAKKSVQKRHE